MKLLFEYTLDYIKRNRRSSFAIMVAILMTSTMLSALCGFLYNIYVDNLNYILRLSGNWHGELNDIILGSELSIIESFSSVEAVMIKGSWKTAQIDDPRRDYLVWRDANAEYWNSMPEGDFAILEGRVPMKTGEIVLSKQYFEYHPELKIGDIITLPTGLRVATDGSPIEQNSVIQSGERFVQTGSIMMTVVGKLDVTTSSIVPAYTALGFLDPAAILPDDKLTVYLRFHNIRDTYKEMPKIAAAVGYKQDEYGNYLLRYNTGYLSRKAVIPPDKTGLLPMLMASHQLLTFIVIGILTAGLFVMIIHNAFVLSSATRLSQLGIFASVGATPKQIKRSVILEALLLTIIPLPFGIMLGQASVGFLIHQANSLSTPDDLNKVAFTIGWQSVLPSILLTILTAWWSALIPAKKIAKMSPIDAIRRGNTETLKKQRRFSLAKLGKLFGLSGELAANALQARRKSYYTSFISLTLSFLTLACFLCINSSLTASNEVYHTEETQWANQDIRLILHNVATKEDFNTVTNQIGDVDGIKTVHWYSRLRTAVWMPEDQFSSVFEEKGGFATVEKYLYGPQLPLLRDGKRRVEIAILGLDDTTFDEYCNTLKIDSAPFYKDNHLSSILYHTVEDIATSTKRNPVYIPFFDIEPGDIMELTEATTDSYEGDFTFDIEVAAITNQLPSLGNLMFNIRPYSAIHLIPMSQARELASHFSQSRISQVYGVIQVSEPSQITPARIAVEQICESYFGSGDYIVTDENEYYADKASGEIVTALMFGFLVVLFSIIGLSNSWSTVRGTLNARRKEFAMLRSVGLSPQGIRHMLSLEALMLGLTPILVSLPLVIIIQGIFLSINEITFIEWLPFIPWFPVIIYILAVLGVTMLAYAKGGLNLVKENIIETIKVDSI